VAWTVVPADDSGSELHVRLGWRLTGPLAQFGRAALAEGPASRALTHFDKVPG
jgi:hypothetical protein